MLFGIKPGPDIKYNENGIIEFIHIENDENENFNMENNNFKQTFQESLEKHFLIIWKILNMISKKKKLKKEKMKKK